MQFCTEYFDFLETLNSESFDDLITRVHSLVYIDFLVANWKLSIISCLWWQKHLICRHVIDAAVKQGHIEYPTEAKNIPIGQKKRERPKCFF